MGQRDDTETRTENEDAAKAAEDLEVTPEDSAQVTGGDGTTDTNVQLQDFHFTKQINVASPKLG